MPHTQSLPPLLVIGALILVGCEREQAAWEKAKESNSLDAVDGFLEKYPQTERRAEAEALQKRLIPSTAFAASASGELAKLHELLQRGVDSSTTDDQGATLLHSAAMGCQGSVANDLIERGGFEVDAVDRSGATPLHWASLSGCREVVELLIASGADLTIMVRQPASGFRIGEGGEVIHFGSHNPATKGTPLHWAAEYGQPDVVRVLLASGAEPDVRTGWGLSPLHCAAKSGVLASVTLLLDAGAGWQGEEMKNGRPIHYSATGAVVSAFVDRGEDLNVASAYRGRPIHTAAYHGFQDAVRHYLDAGVNVDEVGSWNVNSGWTSDVTPLWVAAYGGHLEVIEILTAAGGNLGFATAEGSSGGSLLHAAAWGGHAEVLTYLLKQGVPVDVVADVPTGTPLAPPWKDITPLGVTAWYGHADAMAVLLDAGADVNRVSSSNWTPLKWACVAEHVPLVELLLERGARYRDDDPPIDQLNTNDEIRHLLREHIRSKDGRGDRGSDR